MFKALFKWRNLHTIRQLSELEKTLTKTKCKYIGLDLHFLIQVLPQINDIQKVFKNHNLVLTEETLDYIVKQHSIKQPNFVYRYIYNVLSQFSGSNELIIIPKTKNLETFATFLDLYNVEDKDISKESIVYYKFFEEHISTKEQFVFLTSDINMKQFALPLLMNKIIYFKGSS